MSDDEPLWSLRASVTMFARQIPLKPRPERQDLSGNQEDELQLLDKAGSSRHDFSWRLRVKQDSAIRCLVGQFVALGADKFAANQITGRSLVELVALHPRNATHVLP